MGMENGSLVVGGGSLSRRKFLDASVGGVSAAFAGPWLLRAATADAQVMQNCAPPDEILFSSATEMAALVRSKQVSAEELVRAHLHRIGQVNPALNAVCKVDADGALEAARAADAALARGDTLGPLHGVPITIKDSFDTKNLVSTGGTTGRAQHVPASDATAVARLRAAGAIILGKTNTPELTISYETDNLIYGRTNNPYDLTRTSGGSSGGAAAILAVGGAALELGSDTAGSIRIPAHFCGIAGLKPTFGRVSRAGHIIPPGGVVGRQTHVGPMARSVADLALSLSIIAGLDPEDPDVVPVINADHTKVKTKGLRVAYFSEFEKGTVSTEIRQAVTDTVTMLSAAGMECIEARPDCFEAADEIAVALNSGDGGEYYRLLLRRYGTTNLHPATARFLQNVRGGVISGRKYSDVLMEWAALREVALKFMTQFDLLICPPCNGPAPKHGGTGSLDFTAAYFFNYVGWPAAVVRAGKSAEGLPIGVQVVGRPWREDNVLAVALLIEQKLGGWKRDFPEQPLRAKSP